MNRKKVDMSKKRKEFGLYVSIDGCMYEAESVAVEYEEWPEPRSGADEISETVKARIRTNESISWGASCEVLVTVDDAHNGVEYDFGKCYVFFVDTEDEPDDIVVMWFRRCEQ